MEEMMSPELRAVNAVCGLTVGVALNRLMHRGAAKRGYKKTARYMQVALPLSIVWNAVVLVKAVDEMNLVHKLEMKYL